MNSVKTQKKGLTALRHEGSSDRLCLRQSTVTANIDVPNWEMYLEDVMALSGMMREARYPDKFIAAFPAFLQQYNAETARERKSSSNKLKRALISMIVAHISYAGSVAYTDIVLVRLIDDFLVSSKYAPCCCL